MSATFRHYSLSVHELVDPLLRAGDIDNRVYNQETMNMGTLLHASFQQKQGNDYLSEYPLSGDIQVEDALFHLQGRADGIIVGGAYPIIDEIKSTVMKLSEFHASQEAWHLGQALCYAYLYLLKTNDERIGVRLTYLSQREEGKEVHDYVFSRQEVNEKVEGYCRDYVEMGKERIEHQNKRDASVAHLKFPFHSFRAGQRELAKYCFGTIKNGGVFLAEAPTGTGKTISTLFPAAKSFKQGRVDRLFYLTAKTTGALAAEEAVGLLRSFGLEARDSRLLSKEKICFCPGRACNPDECPYAKGYYTKLRGAIKKAVETMDRFLPDDVIAFAQEEAICPFEFQLDLSLEADIVIADYNYFIDPIVHLQRYFDDMVDSSSFVVLMDEAHNLIERTRECFSCQMSTSLATAARKSLKGKEYQSLRKALRKVEDALEELDGPEYGEGVLDQPPVALEKALDSFKKSQQRFGKAHPGLPIPEAVKEFSREGNRYLRIRDEQYGPSYQVTIGRYKGKPRNTKVRLYCIDPAPKLKHPFHKVKSVIAFSATLSPFDYFEKAITGSLDAPSLLLPSPFPKENFELILAPKVSTKYKERQAYLDKVASYLEAFVSGKKGNYFLYFPSYEYLEAILPLLDFGSADVHVQTRSMNRLEQEEFLSHFQSKPKKTTIGLLTLGGSFSEGIDLIDDRLIGVAIVGVGLPTVSFENELVRSYYDVNGEDGFAFAYKNPGMNKVMQAVGRLIRSETDRGVALLIDERYMQEEYRSLFRRVYSDYEVALDESEIAELVKNFFKKKAA